MMYHLVPQWNCFLKTFRKKLRFFATYLCILIWKTVYLSFLYYALNYSKNHHAIGKKAKKVAALDSTGWRIIKAPTLILHTRL